MKIIERKRNGLNVVNCFFYSGKQSCLTSLYFTDFNSLVICKSFDSVDSKNSKKQRKKNVNILFTLNFNIQTKMIALKENLYENLYENLFEILYENLYGWKEFKKIFMKYSMSDLKIQSFNLFALQK
jgi:hypothetical protein